MQSGQYNRELGADEDYFYCIEISWRGLKFPSYSHFFSFPVVNPLCIWVIYLLLLRLLYFSFLPSEVLTGRLFKCREII